MIFDTLSYLPQYLPPDVWKCLEAFVSRLGSDLTDGEYPIQNSDIFARSASYRTKPPPEGRFEAHKRYADLQIVLAGSERIDVTPLNTVQPDTDYDESNDIRFYKAGGVPAVQLLMVPGSFALFFPQDLHCPQLTPPTGIQDVKKVVVKIDMRLFMPGTDPP